MNLTFTTHHNWDWVVSEGIAQLVSHSATPINEKEFIFLSSGRSDRERSAKLPALAQTTISKVDRSRQLPSEVYSFQLTGCYEKPSYSLFKVELCHERIRNTVFQLCHVDTANHELEFLDAKDNLYRIAMTCSLQKYLPASQLIEWDCEDLSYISELPSRPALLKAPLGSGGFGLYFVYSKFDVLAVIRGHRTRAEEHPGFLDGLKRDYDRVPAWTLQRLVPVIKVKVGQFDMCKCQIRAYVVLVDGEMYLYPVYEVRLPIWSIPLDDILASESAQGDDDDPLPPSSGRVTQWSDSVEQLCVGSGRARPYNEGRDKKRTRRLLLSEIEELRQAGAEEAVRSCVQGFFGGLTELITERRQRNEGGRNSSSSSSSSSSSGSSSSSSSRGRNIVDGDGTVTCPSIVRKSVAILGVDLVISEKSCSSSSSSSSSGSSNSSSGGSSDSSSSGGGDGSRLDAFIVEVNNNPAMPSPAKHSMSEQYRQHLVDLAAAIIGLGLSHCNAL